MCVSTNKIVRSLIVQAFSMNHPDLSRSFISPKLLFLMSLALSGDKNHVFHQHSSTIYQHQFLEFYSIHFLTSSFFFFTRIISSSTNCCFLLTSSFCNCFLLSSSAAKYREFANLQLFKSSYHHIMRI